MPSRLARGTTVVIGDVHGDRARLGAMLHRLAGHQGQIVLVGDYVNRGPDASGVLELLIEARAVWRHRIVLLAGNHEGGLLRYLDTGDFAEFAAMGGMSTIRSYVGVAHGDVRRQFRRALPKAHEQLLREGLATHFVTDDVFVSHAGFDPDNPSDWSRTVTVETSHPELFRREDPQVPRPTVVFGHYVQKSGLPWVTEKLICVDTGCGTTGGSLTAVILPHRELISA